MGLHSLWKTASIGCLGLSMVLLPGAALAQWVQAGADIDGEASLDESGWSVSLSADGSRVAIGAPKNDGNGSDSGHVRVYQWIDPNWVQLGTDINGDEPEFFCGTSVSISADGSRVAVGTPEADGNGIDSGHVRVYEWFDWTSTWLLVGSDIEGEAEWDKSGWSVSLSANGSRVAIGAPLNNGNGSDSGHVRVYQWVEPNWVQLGNDIDGDGSFIRSGSSVPISADGSRVAVGAPDADGNGIDSGHVRVYEWFDWTSTWLTVGSEIGGEGEHDLSGFSVSLSADGSLVAIGSPGSSAGGPAAGRVRIFSTTVRIGTSEVHASSASSFNNSGRSVFLSEDG